MRLMRILTSPQRLWSKLPRFHLPQLPFMPRLPRLFIGRRRTLFLGGIGTAAIVLLLGFFVVDGVFAARETRHAFKALEAELTHLTAVDFLQVGTHSSLKGLFREAEEAAGRLRSRIRPLTLLQWLPVVGDSIERGMLLVDAGFFGARAGSKLSDAFQAALESTIAEDIEGEKLANQVAKSLRDSATQLSQTQEDLQRVAQLRERMRNLSVAGRYVSLMDSYLPAIDTLVYLSRTSPELIGSSYVITREVSNLGKRAVDPLEVISNPGDMRQALDRIKKQALALESSLVVVRQAVEGEGDAESIRATVKAMERGVRLLRHLTNGIQGLVITAEAGASAGFLSEEFGSTAGVELERAVQELELARQQAVSLQSLRLGEDEAALASLLPVTIFDEQPGIPVGTVKRLELLLDQVIDATAFLRTFLGFEGPRTYLLLGQNQNEIRATGGFIGVAVEMKLDEGRLVDLIYHDSTTVDPQPYSLNPSPPDGLYWYLWHDRMLFRDANWNPHFPAAAAKLAQIFQLGQGVKVDGVITGSKGLTLDMVELLGDVKVPEVEEVLSRDRAEGLRRKRLPYPYLPRHTSTRDKRCFDEDLFFQLKERLTASTPPLVRRQLVELLRSHIERKNIFIHVFDPEEGSFLWERGWNGAITPVDHDYLMVIDSSLPGHAVAQVERNLEYSVSLNTDQPLEARLRLRYSHGVEPRQNVCRQSEAGGLENCYWNFFRVYVSSMATEIYMPKVPLHPGAEKLIWGYPDADSASIVRNADIGPAALTELSGYMVAEPGSTTTIPIQYQLPSGILRSIGTNLYEYRLLIQKQPGMDSDGISVAVELPPNVQLQRASPSSFLQQGRWLVFDFILESDTLVTVLFRTGG